MIWYVIMAQFLYEIDWLAELRSDSWVNDHFCLIFWHKMTICLLKMVLKLLYLCNEKKSKRIYQNWGKKAPLVWKSSVLKYKNWNSTFYSMDKKTYDIWKKLLFWLKIFLILWLCSILPKVKNTAMIWFIQDSNLNQVSRSTL